MSDILPKTDLGQEVSSKNKILILLFLLVPSTGMIGWNLTAKPLNNHESYVGIVAREMLQSGDWVVPTCNGKVRLQKTPLNYWLTAIIGLMHGRVDEFAVKLPSMLCAVFSVLVIIYFVEQWLGFRTAVISAAVWATSLCFIRYSQNGRPEMTLTFSTSTAMLAFYSGLMVEQRKKQVIYFLIFWVCFALGMLAKGPAPLPLVTVPLFIYFLVFRMWKHIPKVLPIIGTMLFLAIVLPWPIAVVRRLSEVAGQPQATGSFSFWKTEFIDRFTGDSVGKSKSYFYYLRVIFQLMPPWVAFIPIALLAPLYKIWGKKRKPMLYLLTWLLGDILIMTLSRGKRLHYILPAMPALAILIGIILEDMIFLRKAYSKKFAQIVLYLHIMFLAASAIAGPIAVFFRYPDLFKPVTVISICILIFISFIFILRRKPVLNCMVVFACYCIFIILSYSMIYLPFSNSRLAKQFTAKVNKVVPQTDKLTAYTPGDEIYSRIVFYLGRKIPQTRDIESTFKKYKNGEWILTYGKYINDLAADERFVQAAKWENSLLVNGKLSDGALYHKPKTLSITMSRPPIKQNL